MVFAKGQNGRFGSMDRFFDGAGPRIHPELSVARDESDRSQAHGPGRPG
jgi:hypothetical protein